MDFGSTQDGLLTALVSNSEAVAARTSDFNKPSTYDYTSLHSFSAVFNPLEISNSAAMSTFLLLNSILGPGIVVMPNVYRSCGILGGFVGFLALALFVIASAALITKTAVNHKIFEYSSLAYKVQHYHI